MLKRILNLSLVFILMLSIASVQFANAESNKIYVLISGINEGEVSAPVVKDNFSMFPIGQILSLTDITGGEAVDRRNSPVHSFVTFRGTCYKFTDGDTNVTEYVVEESGTCFELTGHSHQLEKAAIFPNDLDGVFVPISFIEKVILEALDKDIEFENGKMTIARFDYKRSQSYVFGNQEDLKQMREEEKAQADSKGVILAMKINSPWLLTDEDGATFDDNDHKVTPVIRNGSTLLPIAPIIERLGGTTKWTGSERKVTISLGNHVIELWIDQKTAFVNGVQKNIPVAPTIINGRTMLPVRFVTENLDATIRWDGDSQIVLVYYGGAQESNTDLFTFDYKITLLDIYQKQEDNRITLEDVVKENQQKHANVQYNDYDPLDYYGRLIHVGDTVASGTFDGIVKKISGTKILVYWNHASFIVEKGKEEETAALFGIKWLSEQWVEAKTVTVSGSGY